MADASDWCIDLQRVGKTYRRGRVRALDDISLRVRQGEIFGLLGPNGAGKSTLVKILMTVIRPGVANGTLLGRPVGHKPTLRRIGYLPEHHRFPRYLSGRQVLRFFGTLGGAPAASLSRRCDELLDRLAMSHAADRKVSTYSKGMAQRVGIAQTLIHDPDLVLLDEPTDGVDPVGRKQIRDLLLQLRGEGKTVFVNSHLLGELEMVCDRVAILAGGQVVRQGTLDELTAGRTRYEIDLLGSDDRPPTVESVAAALGRPALPQPPAQLYAGPGVAAPTAPPTPVVLRPLSDADVPLDYLPHVGMLRFSTEDPAAVQGPIDALRRAGLTVRRVQPLRPTLEDLFIEVVHTPAS